MPKRESKIPTTSTTGKPSLVTPRALKEEFFSLGEEQDYKTMGKKKSTKQKQISQEDESQGWKDDEDPSASDRADNNG